jgi:hypothetical protein
MNNTAKIKGIEQAKNHFAIVGSELTVIDWIPRKDYSRV